MRVACVGGGPGSLFFASLLKQADPAHEVTVFERDPLGSSFGFGVVFSDATLGNIAAADPQLMRDAMARSVRWSDIEVRIGGTAVRAGGNGFAAAARKDLLAALHERAVGLGVDVRYEAEVEDPLALAGAYDLVVAGDGLNSCVRQAVGERFGTTIDVGAAKYIWFATPCPFDALTFVFAESEHGHFAVHAYPFDERTSTFIVECDEDAWQASGLAEAAARELPRGASDEVAMRYCEQLFAPHLQGHGLIGNASRWASFRTVRNATWVDGNVALIGDAAHTAHFSVGSGTKMAMEDAIELVAALGAHDDLPAALAAYEAAARPSVERIQAAGEPSLRWWERFGRWTGFTPEQFTYHFLSRSLTLRHGTLRRRDPRLTARVERAFAEAHGAPRGADPQQAPLSLGPVRLANRVVVPVRARRGVAFEATAAPAAAAFGAGLVVVEGLMAAGSIRAAGPGLAAAERAFDATFGIAVAAGLDSEELAALVDAAAGAGFRVLELAGGGGGLEQIGERLADAAALARDVWPREEGAIVARVELPPGLEIRRDEAAVARLGAQVRDAGVDGVALGFGHSPTAPDLAARLQLADVLRNELGLVVGLAGAVGSAEELTGALLAGRADFARAWPSVSSGPWRDAMGD